MDKADLEKTKEIDTITDISDEKLEEDCEVIDDDKTIVGDKIVEENNYYFKLFNSFTSFDLVMFRY